MRNDNFLLYYYMKGGYIEQYNYYIIYIRKMKFLNILIFLSVSSFICSADIKDNKKISIKEGIAFKKYEKVNQLDSENALVGKFAISGNTIILDRNKEIYNKGELEGFLESEGEETFDDSVKGAIVTDAQGNAIASTAYSSFSNKGDVNRKILEISNQGKMGGEQVF